MMTVLKDRSTKGHISGLELLDLLVIDVNVPAYILMNLYGIWKRGGEEERFGVHKSMYILLGLFTF